MSKLNLALYLLFLSSIYADMISTLLCIQYGHIEQNSIYLMIGGTNFWALFIIVNGAVMITFMIAEQKWRYMSIIILIPIISHAICAIHNIGLVM